jgi:DNA-binding transcriptional LysR family regulator
VDRLRAYQIFVAVVSQQSFVRAAKALDTSPANVTRYVNELETHLGTRLLHRNSRKISLTEAGEIFFDRGKSILQQITEVEALASNSSKPRGKLRINASVSFGVRYLAPLWPAFMEQHPNVALDVTLDDKVVDLVAEGFDMAVRISREGSASYVARKLAASRDVVCASPAYVRRNGSPRVPADLARHICIGYTYAPRSGKWRFTDGEGTVHTVPIHSAMQTNSCDTGRAAALSGAGIIWQPLFMVGDDIKEGRLLPLLQDYHLPAVDVWAVYPSRRHLSAQVRAMVDFLANAFKEGQVWGR